MNYTGPLGDQEELLIIHGVNGFTKEFVKIPLGYAVVPRTELTQPGDLCWQPIEKVWGVGSMTTGNRVRNFHCVVRKEPVTKNIVIIE